MNEVKVPTIDVVMFIMDAHSGQTRMDGAPYFIHPLRCLRILREQLDVKSDFTDQVMLLHDVEEDCQERGYDLDYLINAFGKDVAVMAHWLCKPPRPKEVDKLEFNKAIYQKLGKEAPAIAVQMKIADRLENLSDPYTWRSDFRARYIADTQNLLDALIGHDNIHLVAFRLQVIKSM